MSIRTRILLAFLVIYAVLFYSILDFVVNEIRPRYLETVEESLNDTAILLTSLVEKELRGRKISTVTLNQIFTNAKTKSISAKIYQVKKTSLNLQVYVTDKKGFVIFDSDDNKRLGKDYSEWNDVFLTLRGFYGARSSPDITGEPATNSLYVAAPINRNKKIIGVLTVVKPEKSIRLFIDLARQKVIIAGVLTFLIFIFLSVIISFWINRPILRLRNYVLELKNHRRVPFPSLESSEIIELGLVFQEMREELEGKKYIEHYVQSMTHELKSPLSSLMGAAELLREEMSTEDRIKFAGNVLNESHRIREIIDRLLLLSALENRQELDHLLMISSHDLIKKITSSMAPQARQQNVNIIDISKKDIIFEGEVFLIRHALLNLLQNSLQQSSKGNTIRIEATSDEKNITFRIIDEGRGIPDYAVSRIFDRFYSLPIKGKTRGTGLGLSFVREAALLHGGTASIENNPTVGATALFTIPLTQE